MCGKKLKDSLVQLLLFPFSQTMQGGSNGKSEALLAFCEYYYRDVVHFINEFAYIRRSFINKVYFALKDSKKQ